MKESPSDYGWSIDYTKKTIVKNFSFGEWFLAITYIQRTSVEEFYKLFQHKFSSSEAGITLPDILERDSFEKPENYPRAYRLKNGWNIDKSSLRFLKSGPLFSENAHIVLVREPNIWKTITIIITFITFAFGILGVLGITILPPTSLFDYSICNY